MKTIIMVLWLAIGSLHAQVLPDGGLSDAPWRPGTAVDVTWRNVIDAAFVDIELWDASRMTTTTLARRVSARAQTYGVMLPDTLRAGTHYVLRIRNSDNPSAKMTSAGYLPIAPSLAPLHPTSVTDSEATRTALVIAPNPTPASALLTWDQANVRTVRVTGSDGVVRMDRDVESIERRIVLPSDRWASGSYVVELIGATGPIGRMLFVVAH